jgi:hypothetical protein
VGQLETLETVTAFGLLPHHVHDAVHQLSPLCVVALCPVVSRTTLACQKEIECYIQTLEEFLLVSFGPWVT